MERAIAGVRLRRQLNGSSTSVGPTLGRLPALVSRGAWARQRNRSAGDAPSKTTVMICRIDAASQWSQRGGSKWTGTGGAIPAHPCPMHGFRHRPCEVAR